MGRASRLCSVATAIGVITAAQLQVAQAAACPSGNGLTARQVRLLQTELMVGALSCRGNATLGLDGKYGSFAHRFSHELKQHADMLKAEFQGNSVRLDRYVTTVANASSSAGLNDAQYCEHVSPLFDAVLAVKPGELHRFAADRAPEFAAASAAGVAGCPHKPAPATRGASATPPWKKQPAAAKVASEKQPAAAKSGAAKQPASTQQ